MVQSLSLLLGLSALRAVQGAPAVDPLRGSTDLQGYNPSNILTDEDTTNVQYELAPGQTNDADLGTFLDFSDIENPQPMRGTKGGTDPGPHNSEVDRQNSDKLAPPGTDHGQTINAQWSMGLSHAKLGKEGAGWSRQQNLNVLPDATAMAGVDMRLEPGGYRELHWHVAGEWALMLNGTVRVQVRPLDSLLTVLVLTMAGRARGRKVVCG